MNVDETNQKIVESVKEALGLVSGDLSFDTELLIQISSALATARQAVNINPVLLTTETVWADLFTSGSNTSDIFPIVAMYVFTKVKLIFDPPAPSAINTYKELEKELIWRLEITNSEEMGDTSGEHK